MLKLVAFSTLLAAVASKCPDDFDLIHTGTCYHTYNLNQYVYAPDGPYTVKTACANYEALPVIVHSQEESDYWYSVGKKNKADDQSYGKIFLGLQCNSHYKWEWIDGSSVDFKPAKYDAALDTNDCSSQYCSWYVDPENGAWKTMCQTYGYVDVYCAVTPAKDIRNPDANCYEYDYDATNNLCYRIGKDALSWDDAEKTCEKSTAHLVAIHSPRDNTLIRNLAVSQGDLNGFHLGAKVGKNKSFEWADGSDFDYEGFAPGFPIEGLGDCLAMEPNIASGPWLNVECSTELPYLCVRKPENSPAEVVCDGSLPKEGDIIRSPGFPTNASTPCDFLLKVDPGYLVEVEILFLEANSCCDKLVLTEGTLGGAVIATVTGDKSAGKKYRTKSQNFMRASWQPQGGYNVQGMMITFRSVKK